MTATKPKSKSGRNGYHEANEHALKRVDAMMSGEPDPGPLMTLEDDVGEPLRDSHSQQTSAEPARASDVPPKGKPAARSASPSRSDRATSSDPATGTAIGGRLDSKIEVVPLKYLGPCPWQPRVEFHEAEDRELGESIKLNGNLTPLVIWKVSGSYIVENVAKHGGKKLPEHFVLAGERRLRGATLAGVASLRCVEFHGTAAEAERFCRLENSKRRNLSPLEDARNHQALLERGLYATAAELATALGITPAALSNQLRVLDLPSEWLDLVSQEKLTLTHLRSLATWADRPSVLECAKRTILGEARFTPFDFEVGFGANERPPTVKEFDEAVLAAVQDASRPIGGRDIWERHIAVDGKSHFTVVQADMPTPAMLQRERGTLDVVEVKGLGPRAFNVEAWTRLSDTAKAKRVGGSLRDSHSEVESNRESKSRSDSATKKLSAAEQRQKAKEAAEQFAKRLARYRTAWLQRKIAASFVDASATTLLTHVIAFAAANGHGGLNRRHEEFGEAVIACGGTQKANRRGYLRETDVWATLATLGKSGEGIDLAGLARTLLATWYAHDFETSSTDTSPDFLDGAATQLGIDFAKEWRLDRDFLELCDKNRLWELLVEWKLPANADRFEKMKRAEVIDSIIEHFDAANVKLKPNCPLPKCLAKLKPCSIVR